MCAALNLQCGVGLVEELGCDSVSKLVSDAALLQREREGGQSASAMSSVIYLSPLIINGAKHEDCYKSEPT